ncbi:DUF397 domain-containing protein [Streptomyces sp. NBC_00009]|uniref:DUF397 domain-containing protein n=1 Tax=Streptomyces sp. NBC_00009 TaxID=2975620 RepID=UPI003248FA56
MVYPYVIRRQIAPHEFGQFRQYGARYAPQSGVQVCQPVDDATRARETVGRELRLRLRGRWEGVPRRGRVRKTADGPNGRATGGRNPARRRCAPHKPRILPAQRHIRDQLARLPAARNPHGPAVAFAAPAWTAFVTAVRTGALGAG